MTLSFGSPWWMLLLGLAPAAALVALRSPSDLSPVRRAATIAVRCALIGLVVFSLADLRLVRRLDRLAVYFAIDRSESIPAAERAAMVAYVNRAAKGRSASRADRVGVLAFGGSAGIEETPREDHVDIDSFVTLVDPEATDIAAAVRLASAAFPEGHARRLVLLSDGNENRESVLEEVRAARSLGMTVDVVPVTWAAETEIAVEKVVVPAAVRIGEPFDVRVVVDSRREAKARLRVFENDRLVGGEASDVRLRPGKNVFDLRARRLETPGRYRYGAYVEPLRPDDDRVLRNNLAYGLTIVEGRPSVLLCATEPELDEPLVQALRAESVDVRVLRPEQLPAGAEDYLGYEAIVLSNVAAHQLTPATMDLFESLVKTVGTGFVMLGGEGSFGVGGYQGTPVERLLPVDMDIKHRKVFPKGALAVVVHSCELDNGNFWARQVVHQAIRLLSPRDWAGVLHYGMSGEQWLFPMTPVAERQRMLNLIAAFNPGDMPSFQTILSMAFAGLDAVDASIKHVIILSDGDPVPPSEDLIASIRAARIKMSTICYGSHGPEFPPRMEALARAGGGEFYYIRGPSELPEIFIRETVKVLRSSISEETFRPALRSGGAILEGIEESDLPPLDGYVIASPKALATTHLVHPPVEGNPGEDPVLATWSYGLGRSIAFTSDAGRRWGKRWTAWRGYQRFWGQCLRWVSRAGGGETFPVVVAAEGARGTAILDAIHADGSLENAIDFRASVIGPDGRSEEIPVRQTGPGRYETQFPLEQRGVYTVAFTRERDGRAMTQTAVLAAPYSPEYRRLEPNVELLRRIAAAGGGTYHDDPELAAARRAFFRRDFPRPAETRGIWRELLAAAACLLFLDVFLRRVVVDYLAAARKAARWLGARRGRKAEAVPAGDARLSALLERKARVRGSAAARPGGDAGIEPAAPEAGASRTDAGGGGGAAATTTPGPSAPAGREPAPRAPPAEEEGSFTSRLLEAKRRALRKDDEGQGKH